MKSTENVAMKFIRTSGPKDDHSPAPKASKAGKNSESTPLPEAKPALQITSAETKTRRVQLLLKPSDYDKLQRTAIESGVSVNRVIEEMIAKLL